MNLLTYVLFAGYVGEPQSDNKKNSIKASKANVNGNKSSR